MLILIIIVVLLLFLFLDLRKKSQKRSRHCRNVQGNAVSVEDATNVMMTIFVLPNCKIRNQNESCRVQ